MTSRGDVTATLRATYAAHLHLHSYYYHYSWSYSISDTLLPHLAFQVQPSMIVLFFVISYIYDLIDLLLLLLLLIYIGI